MENSIDWPSTAKKELRKITSISKLLIPFIPSKHIVLKAIDEVQREIEVFSIDAFEESA